MISYGAHKKGFSLTATVGPLLSAAILASPFALSTRTDATQDSKQVLPLAHSLQPQPVPTPYLRLATASHTSIADLHFSPDGKSLATTGDTTVSLWDMSNGVPLYRFGEEGREGYARTTLFGRDGRTLWVAHQNGTLVEWERETGRQITKVSIPQKAQSLGLGPVGRLADALLDPDGKTVLTYHGDDVFAWNTQSGTLKRLIHVADAVPTLTSGLPMRHSSDPPGPLAPVPPYGKRYFRLEGHGWHLVALSPDGRTIATGSDVTRVTESPSTSTESVGFGAVVCLWDAKTGRLQRILRDAGWHIASLAFSPDGKWIASGGERLPEDGKYMPRFPGEVRVWDFSSGVLRHTLTDIGAEVRALTFSPDSRFVAGGGLDADVAVWEATTGHLAHKWPQELKGLNESTVNSLTFSPQGDLLASAGGNGDVHMRRFPFGEPLRGLSQDQGLGAPVAFSPDTRLLLARHGLQSIAVWDVYRATLLRTLRLTSQPGSYLGRLELSLDGRTLAAEVVLPVLPSPEDRITGIEKDGQRGANEAQKPSDRDANGRGAEIELWDVAKGQPHPWSVKVSGSVKALAFSPDSTRIAVGSESYFVPQNTYSRPQSSQLRTQVWDVSSGRLMWMDEEGSEYRRIQRGELAFSPDSQILAGTRWGSQPVVFGSPTKEQATQGEVRLWNAATGKLEGTIAPQASLSDFLAFLPPTPQRGAFFGRRMFTDAAKPTPSRPSIVTLADVNLCVWDAGTGALKDIVSNIGPELVIAPSGTSLATSFYKGGGSDGDGVVSDPRPSRVEIRPWRPRPYAYFSFDKPLVLPDAYGSVFSHDGRLIATGGETGIVLWNRYTGQRLATLSSLPDANQGSPTSPANSPEEPTSTLPLWFAFTPTGDYTGSEGIEKFVQQRWGDVGLAARYIGQRRPDRVQLSIGLSGALTNTVGH